MGILIQILIQFGCIYMEANWIQSRLRPPLPLWINYDPDSELDSGPGAHVNVPLGYIAPFTLGVPGANSETRGGGITE